MNIILLERVPNLGQLGDVVRVKDGYARNFLLPRGKALRATKGNLEQPRFRRTQRLADLQAPLRPFRPAGCNLLPRDGV